MKEDMNIEKILKQYKSSPGPHVKQWVMNRFAGMHENGSITGKSSFWTRPVPMYLFAAGVILALGLSFYAGRMTSPTQNRQTAPTDAVPALHEGSLQDIEWRIAPNDLL